MQVNCNLIHTCILIGAKGGFVLRRKLLLSIIVLGMIGIGITLKYPAKNDESQELRVEDYFPKKTMIKHFSGGFENGGFKHIIDKIHKDKVQVKQIDTGTGVICIYQVSENDITLIFTKEESDGKFKGDYMESLKANTSDVILKAPLEVGAKWSDDTDMKYEITGINVEVVTPAGKFSAVEVTEIRDSFEVKRYYAKDLGLVKTSIKGYGEDELIKIE
jgi:hypothetical protein